MAGSRISKALKTVGRRAGRMMLQYTLGMLAPSMRAALMIESSMPRSPAMNMAITKPVECQTATKAMA